MLWFNLSLVSAASKAANQAITKKLTREFSVLETAAFGQFAAGILVLPLFLFPGVITVPADPAFHIAAAVTIGLNIIAILLLTDAIRRSDLSYAIPFLGLTPVFTIFMGWSLRGETISTAGAVGIFLVFAGALGIDTRSIKDWAVFGGRRIFNDKGVLLVIVVALLYSITSVYDKTATLLSDPPTFVWYSGVVRALLLVTILFGRKGFSGSTRRTNTFTRLHAGLFTLLGLTFLAEAFAQMAALQTGLVAYVIGIKRTSILMTSLAGMILYKEQFTWARLSGALLIVAGAGIIYLS